jgi:HD-like signal output (HDOD) protein
VHCSKGKQYPCRKDYYQHSGSINGSPDLPVKRVRPDWRIQIILGAQTVGIEKQRIEADGLPWTHLHLPPFPQIAVRVLQLAGSENIQLHELSDLISSDPAFASEVLTIANSLLYAPRFPITSIQHAIAVLGANHLQGLCVTVGVRAYLDGALSRPSMRAVWRHNLACGMIAELLASSGFIDRHSAYTCGVIHDIGRLALAVIRPREYAVLLGMQSGPPASILEDEREIFGLDHCQAGQRLIADWKLPVDFESIVSEHHAPGEENTSWNMDGLINISCRLADAAGYAAFPRCEVTPYEQLLDELPARERRRFHADLESLIIEVRGKIEALESA